MKYIFTTLFTLTILFSFGQYNMCDGNDTLTAISGQLYDSGGPTGVYGYNENCSVLIKPDCATDITLNFTYFHSPTAYDIFRVYDGDDATSPLLASYGYITVPPSNITSTSGSLYITFTSNGSYNYGGFSIDWTSNSLNTSAPTPSFSISDINPTLGSTVTFSNTSTNTPSVYTWDFGDGTFSNEISPNHVYTTSGIYDVKLISANCSNIDSLTQTITVQNAPNISFSPTTISETITSCNDSIIVPVTVTNNGTGAATLSSSISLSSEFNGTTNYFLDGFESGNYNNWQTIGSNTYTISNTSPASGNSCLSILGTSSNGLEYNFTPDTINYFSVKLRSDDFSGYSNHCQIGNANNATGIANLYHFGSNTYRIYSGSGTTTHSITNTWTHFEFKNINYNTKKFDLYIDGVLTQPNLTFANTTTTNISKISLHNADPNNAGYYDDIQIGHPLIPNWVTTTQNEIDLAVGSTTTFNISLYSDSLNTGTYYSDIVFNINNILTLSDTIPITLTVDGNPLIEFSDTCLNLDPIMQYTTYIDTFKIYNTGCEDLFITELNTTIPEYTITANSTSILPGDSTLVLVEFTPTTVGIFNTSIIINNNDIDTTICLTGSSFGAPIISYSPISITEAITGCNDSIVIPVTVNNTGLSVLNSNLTFETDMVNSNNFFFDGFENGNYNNWTESSSNTYDVTNINPASGDYCLSILGTSTYGLTYDFQPDSIDYFSITMKSDALSGLNNYCYIGGYAVNGISTITHVGANTYQVYASNTEHVYTTVNDWTNFEFKNINYSTHTFDLYIDENVIEIGMNFSTNSDYMSRISLFNSSSTEKGYYDNIIIGKDIIPDWWTASIDTLNILPGNSTTFDVTLYSDSLNTGTYSSNLIFNSNDPLNSLDTIPVALTVMGNPIIALSDACLNYGDIMENTTQTDTLTLYNIGCDTLFITNIQPSINQFTTNLNSTYILPDDSVKLTVTFSPISVGNYDSYLSIYNNNIDTTICFTGNALESPQISFSPTSINETFFSCSDSVTVPITITNNGLATLSGIVEIPSVVAGTANPFFDGFEDGTYGNWTTVGTSTKTIENSNAATGNKCLSLKGIYPYALEYNFTPEAVDYFSVKLKSDDLSGSSNFCMIGNNSAADRILNLYHSGNNSYVVYAGSIHTYIIVNTWTHIELKNINYITKTFDLYIDGSLQQAEMAFFNTTISSISKIRLYNSDNYNKGYYDDIQVGKSFTSQWIVSDLQNINVSPGSDTTFNVTLYSDSLISGTYNSNVILNTNDPLSLIDTIPVTLLVDGEPELSLSDSCLNFNTIMENTTLEDTLVIYNTACDTLFISEVISNNIVYTTNWSAAFILPNDSIELIITFAPTSVGTYSSLLTLTNNAIDTIICLNGSATPAPDLVLNPQEINLTIDPCLTFTDTTLYIHNNGLTNLNWNIMYSNVIEDNFDQGINYYLWDFVNSENTSSICGTASGSKALRFYGSGVRNAQTESIQVGAAGVIKFSIKFGTGSASSSCDYADLGEDVKLEYSTNNGLTWHLINTYITTDFPNFTEISESIPQDALSTSTIFKWEQVSHSGYNQDIWLLDELSITYAANNSPIPAQTIPGDSTPFNINFNSVGLTSGTYYRPMIITSNDPEKPIFIINNTITISEKPCAEFGYVAPGTCSSIINFIDSSFNNPTNWEWDFGDGSTSTEQNPTHVFSGPGNYLIEFVACTNNLCDTTIQIVTIQSTFGPQPTSCIPSSSISSTTNGITNVSLNTISNSSDMDNSGYQDFSCSHSTTLVAGGAYEINIETSGSTNDKTFDVWLDINNDGNFSNAEKLNHIVTSINQPIIPILIPITVETYVPLRMRISYDKTTGYTYPCDNVYNGEYEDYTIIVEPNDQPPNTNFTFSEQNSCSGIFEFNDNSTFSPTNWLWSFGDNETSLNQNPTHTYNSPGTYIVSLLASNDFGSNTYYSTVVANTFGNCSIEVSTQISNNQPIQFTTNCGNASSWQWDFGDGTQSYIQSPVHLYSNPGPYTVTLLSQDNNGCFSNSYHNILLGSIGIEESNLELIIYPNPTNETFKIINPGHLDITKVILTNYLGEQVYSINKPDLTSNINIQHLQSGVYFVNIVLDSGERTIKKIIINN